MSSNKAPKSSDCQNYANQPTEAVPPPAPITTPAVGAQTQEKRNLTKALSQPSNTMEYIVKSTDTLTKVAARYDVTPGELAVINRIHSRLIFPGQVLYIPLRGKNAANLDSKPRPASTSDVEGSTASPIRKPAISIEQPELVVKINAKHITDGQGVVTGTLLITPNNLLFIPNVSDPLVIEHGTECYDVTVPMAMVVATALYSDIAHMRVRHVDASSIPNLPKAELYHLPGQEKPAEGEQKSEAKSDEKAQGGDSQAALKEEVEETSVAEVSKPETDESRPEVEDKKSTEPEVSPDDVIKKADNDDVGDEAKKQETKVADEVVTSEKEVDDVITKPEMAPEATDVVDGNDTSKPLIQWDSEIGEEQDNNSEDVMGSGKDGVLITVGEAASDTRQPDTTKDDDITIERPDDMIRSRSQASEVCLREQKTPATHEKVMKRLSYPMESLSSISKSIAQTPKSLVGFSKGILFRSAEDQSGDSVDPKEPKIMFENDSWEQSPSVKKMAVNSMDNIVPRLARPQEDSPLFLCVRIGRPLDREVTVPAVALGMKSLRGEYWFSIPRDRVQEVYRYFQRCAPNKYRDVDNLDYAKLGFEPVDDSSIAEEAAVVSDDGELGGTPSRSLTTSTAAFLRRAAATPSLRIFRLFEGNSMSSVLGMGSASSTDWDIVCLPGDGSRQESLMSADVEMLLPECSEPSECLTEEHRKALYRHLPPRAEGYMWRLAYATIKHGFSLKTLYREMLKIYGPVLLVIQDTTGSLFGALLSEPLRLSDHFYGTGESFLYTFYPEFKIYPWSGENMYFVKGNTDSLIIGSGDCDFGLYLDGDLFHGRSARCRTYRNEILSAREDFVVKTLEVWCFAYH